MQVGMVGLGRMGSNMVRRLLKAGHECIVYNRSPEPVRTLVGEGASGAASLPEFVRMLRKPRAIWLMVPAAAVEPVLTELTTIIDAGDVLIDGGNSYYHDDIRRASWLSAKGIHYLDVGTSGGVSLRLCSGSIPSSKRSHQVSTLRLARLIVKAQIARPRRDTFTVDRTVRATSSKWSTTA